MRFPYIINCLLINNIRFIFIKMFHINNFYFSLKSFIHTSVTIDIRGKGCINLGRKCKIRKNTYLSSKENGKLEIGDNAFINTNCNITSRKRVSIGKNVMIGPGTVIVDHDHAVSDKIEPNEFVCEEVIIGDNVWIGANCTILRGTIIGNNCIVAAGTILKGKYDENSTIYQKRETIIKKRKKL